MEHSWIDHFRQEILKVETFKLFGCTLLDIIVKHDFCMIQLNLI